MGSTLPLDIATGILIAAGLMYLIRLVFVLFRRGDPGMGFLLGVFLALFVGGLILQGLGTIQ